MQIRFKSTASKEPTPSGTVPMSVHVPGLLRWAKAGFGSNRKQDKQMVTTIAECFSVRPEVALAILSGEVETVVEGEDVLIEWPGDDPIVPRITKEDE